MAVLGTKSAPSSTPGIGLHSVISGVPSSTVSLVADIQPLINSPINNKIIILLKRFINSPPIYKFYNNG